MHIKFLSISEVAAGKRHDFISNWGKPFAHCSKMTVSTRERLHNSSFFLSNQHTYYHITLHSSSTMVGGHEKQIDSNTTSTSSSASTSAVSADWDIAPPLRNVRVDTQYVGIIEEQKQHIKQLQEELAEFNLVWYRKLPENASRGEYDHNRPHKSASNCFLCKSSHLARIKDASKELE